MSGHVLDHVESLLRRHVVFASDAQVAAVTLWIAHTYAIDAADVTPYLAITSPEKRCGKSSVLKLLQALAANPWSAITPSEAVTFRKIERDHPTLLLDEADAIFGPKAREHEGLRAILNAGYERGVSVPRCVGPSQQLQDFDVFCAKAIAGIGNLPDTVTDRSILIRLQRKAKGERVEKIRRREVAASAEPIRDALIGWVAPIVERLREARPDMPAGLNDRAEDGWEPLFALADAAGGAWPARARRSAVALARGVDIEDDSPGVHLLHDLALIVLGLPRFGERVATEDVLRALRRLPESPWGDYEGKPLTAERLAGLLRGFNVRASQKRHGDERIRGYALADLAHVFDRYLPSGENPLATRDKAQTRDGGNPHGYGDVTGVTGSRRSGEDIREAA